MQYGRLGQTGLEISRLCVGCMSFGVASQGDHSWTLGEDDSRVIIRRALEAGLNFFDTANVYSGGTSEEIVGRALKDFARREEVVIATKVNGRMRPGPNGAGLSRRHILEQIDASLKRLGTDHIDLYQIHRWDKNTPIEETLEALNDVVRMGKARYIGASSMFAWQFAKALFLQDQHGWARFVSMQDHLNLLYREEEREMLPLCIDQGIGVLPWSPLARGRLAREPGTVTSRESTDGRRPSSMVPKASSIARSSTPSAPWQRSAARSVHRWPWPGSGRRPRSAPRSSAPPRSPISTPPSHRSTLRSMPTRSPCWKPITVPKPSPATNSLRSRRPARWSFQRSAAWPDR